MLDAIIHHWPMYLIEGALLGLFMISACTAVVVFEHPDSPVRRAIASGAIRRVLIGVLMGLTAIALIYSPWGQRSGAHMNPGTTMTFFVLGKVGVWDAVFYVLAQFVGGCLGVGVARAVLGGRVAHERVNFATTTPGRFGLSAAWIGEFVIAFGMMSMVLYSTNHSDTAAYTGVFAGLLVAAYIAIEAPISGMSMNPARTLASALAGRTFRGLWIYFTAPPMAMLGAAALYQGVMGEGRVYCAKLDHRGREACHFNCTIERMPGRGALLSGESGIKR